MFSYSCVDCDEQIADSFCKDYSCKEKRLFCSKSCLRTKQKHIAHIHKTENIEQLSHYCQDISTQCQELIEKLDILFQEVEQVFKQIKIDLVQKYQISEENLQQLNSNHINNALCNFVKFEEKKQIIFDMFNKSTKQYKENLQICIEELHINLLEVPSQVINIPPQQFQYELLQNCRIKSLTRCCSFAFNNDSSIIVSGLENGLIQIYEFINENMQRQKEVNEHKGAIYCLEFMKKVNQFISGGEDAMINIWSLNIQNQWYNSFKINGFGSITSLIIDNNENIFSGNRHHQITVFNKSQDWKCTQKFTEHTGIILSLCLNPKQDMLISCADEDTNIKLYQKNNQIWSLYQNIEVKQWGYRLCFIDNYRFTFHSYLSTQLDIYENNLLNNLFTKTNQVEIKNNYQKEEFFFPFQFIQSRSILICKIGYYVNLFRVMPNREIQLIQSINFLNEQLYGKLNENGQYLITYAENSLEIQIRKYQKLKSF